MPGTVPGRARSGGGCCAARPGRGRGGGVPGGARVRPPAARCRRRDPPGVDPQRFRRSTAERAAVRRSTGIDPDRPLVLGLSRLVPRKGFDVVIAPSRGLDDSVQLAIAGGGRDERAAHGPRGRRTGASAGALPRSAARRRARAAVRVGRRVRDVCRDRWGGLEAEGFGIVFVEAAACGVPSVAGRSGGSHEAVVDGETGFVVPPRDVDAVRDALARLLGDDAGSRPRMGAAAARAGRRRALVRRARRDAAAADAGATSVAAAPAR